MSAKPRGDVMSNRDQYPPGVPCWVDTAQPDPGAALDFYGALLGWEFIGPGPMPGDPPGEYHVARIRGRDVAGISSLPPGGPALPAWTTHVAVDSADAAADRARAAGGTVVVEPFDAPPAGRMAVLSDPDGAVFCVWQAGARHGAQVLNEPSAWAMSMLNAREADSAKAFYGEVFGWQADPFAPGVELFRLPGYVGGEPEQPVPRDVVAVLASGEGLPVWSVDFWIDDAESAAARATELGGSVVVAPREIPGFLNTVIADPAGAVLSLSELRYSGAA
jgi:predicted enzyme related to lactoylglutathione lyase